MTTVSALRSMKKAALVEHARKLEQENARLRNEAEARQTPRQRAAAMLDLNTPVRAEANFNVRNEFWNIVKRHGIDPTVALKHLGVNTIREYDGTFAEALQALNIQP